MPLQQNKEGKWWYAIQVLLSGKSKDAIVWTESTSGVANPAKTKDTSSKRCQSLALPDQPKLKRLYIFF